MVKRKIPALNACSQKIGQLTVLPSAVLIAAKKKGPLIVYAIVEVS